MHFIYTTVDTDGHGQLHVQQSNGIRDLIAAAIYLSNDELLCGRDAHTHCLFNPPNWAYNIGRHHRYSLGGAIWHLGQWSAGRFYGMTQASQHTLSPEELEHRYGWDPEDLTA